MASRIKLNKLNHIFINLSPLLALPHPHLSLTRLTPSPDASVRWTLLTYFPFKRLPILPLLPISNGSWMYVIIPCITGTSKPNDWTVLNDRLHQYLPIGINPLNPELNPIYYLLALLGAHHFLHVSRIRVKSLTLTVLMSYIYIWSTYSWCF